jgi:hypothetical protein
MPADRWKLDGDGALGAWEGPELFVRPALRKAGHAINRQEGHNGSRASDEADFKTAYEQDAGKGSLADHYYHRENGRIGRDEACADSHGEYLRDPAAMKAEYSYLYAYWPDFYGAENEPCVRTAGDPRRGASSRSGRRRWRTTAPS